MSSTRWCFTHNNYANTDWVDQITDDEAVYYIYGKEVGASGTPHLQGFIIFKKMKRLSAVRKLCSEAHWEVAKGTSEQAADYCKKDGAYTTMGKLPMTKKEQGDAEQQRWKRIREAAEEGNFHEIPEKVRFLHHKLIKIHHNDALRARQLHDTEERHLWYYGPTGTGKSRKARTDHPDAYLKSCNKWWDGYTDEETVIIEDFDKDHKVLCHHLKIWADRYPFPAEVKGGSIKIRPQRLIVTSNYHPSDIWEDDRDLEPIKRRFLTVFFPNTPLSPKTP